MGFFNYLKKKLTTIKKKKNHTQYVSSAAVKKL